MKKYITILGLLLAGSLLANADITTTFQKNTSDVTKTKLNVTGGVTATVTSLKDSTNKSSPTNTQVFATDAFEVGKDTSFFAPMTQHDSEWTATFGYNSPVGTTVTVSAIALKFKLFDKNGSFVADTSSSTQFTFSGHMSGKNISSKTTTGTDGTVLLQLEQPVNLTLITTGIPSTLSITAKMATGNADHRIGLESITFYSSVPEPSAFGLLAGIGALALVASRRRRK